MKLRSILLTLSLSASSTQAAILTNITPHLVGNQFNGSTTVVGIGTEQNTPNCSYNSIYFNDEKEVAVSLSIAMTAKVSGKKLRVDYEQPDGDGGQCLGTGIYFYD